MAREGGMRITQTSPQPYFPIKFKNRTPLLVAVQRNQSVSAYPLWRARASPQYYSNDFVLLNDDIKH
jgi:hypothetical protein